LLREALQIAEDDTLYVGAKVRRAVEMRYRQQEGALERFWGDPLDLVKVALVLIERSVRAWRTIAKSTNEETPASIARQLEELHASIEAEFPETMKSALGRTKIAPRSRKSQRSRAK
jgi:hypothetical protein